MNEKIKAEYSFSQMCETHRWQWNNYALYNNCAYTLTYFAHMNDFIQYSKHNKYLNIHYINIYI